MTGADESFVKPLESDSSTNLINDLPSLKYSPNTGKTFESKKVSDSVFLYTQGCHFVLINYLRKYKMFLFLSRELGLSYFRDSQPFLICWLF